MDIHIVMTMPTGTRKCLGTNPAEALSHAGRTLALVDTITMDKHRVETPAYNTERGVAWWCPVDSCAGSVNGVQLAARAALDAVIEANAEIGNPNLLDPDEVLYHLDNCTNMACTGCSNAVMYA